MSTILEVRPQTTRTREAFSDANGKLERIVEEVERVIIGQTRTIRMILYALLADGHVLLEGVPGLAKTLMVSAICKAIGGEFKRIQMLPDMLPSDITGNYVFIKDRFVLEKGPIHEANFILADEINRTPPRTQSALLESMQERQITLTGGETFPLKDPFMVLATMNPIEQEGTYRLPEAQIDRFLLKIVIDYIDPENEKRMLQTKALDQRNKVASVEKVVDLEDVLSIRNEIRETVVVGDAAAEYIIAIVDETRKKTGWDEEDKTIELIRLGASPRAIFALRDMARVKAYAEGRDFVLPEDVQFVALDVLRHRIFLEFRAASRGWTPAEIVAQTLKKVKAP
ncbi:MAG: MoxR family ATPase [Desulfobacteraceae bacterium]|nr:MAG: MoxR family ATPase [Desulfobacteraceae bacterium]